MNRIRTNSKVATGFSLLEVVLAMAIFAIGMLALTHLQSNLARSSGDANARTVATNIAEEIIEHARAFVQVGPDPNGVLNTYADIVNENLVRSRGGLDYDVSLSVQDYYFDADRTSVGTTAPEGRVAEYSDFKYLVVDVTWSTNQEFEVDEDTTAQLGTGSIRLTQLIPSSPGLSSLMVASTRDAPIGGPVVDFNPGLNPDIVRLTLGDGNDKFKESSSPEPDVMRDEHVETWFDVVTYSQVGEAQAKFLRREEFVAITCDCMLDTSPAEADWGLKPTLWNGVDYTEGERVSKPIGISLDSIQQSEFCTVCCRDHHDGSESAAEDVYQLSNVGNGADHPHYASDGMGNILPTPVGHGDAYVEACRLVRKDGFLRVAQDANQGTLIGFPEGYLNFTQGIDAYSDYVVDAVADYYTGSQTALPQPNPPDGASTHVFPARTTLDTTDLPTAYFADSQQLRARAVYTDYLTPAAQAVIDACFPRNQDGSPATEDCPVLYAASELEIYPFFDLQMTLLARWNNASLNNLVTVTNEPIQTANEHSRGVAALVSGDGGQSRITITSHDGNLGLTSTGPIDLTYNNHLNVDSLYIDANGADTPVPPIGNVVSGALRSSLRRVPAADLSLQAAGALCGQTNTAWACVVTGPSTLTVGNYYLNNPRVYVCSDLAFVGESGGTTKATATTTFTLPGSGDGLDIWITDNYDLCNR